ncbi:MAG: nuclear transport factor 2 family protein [Sphingomicrobium sp.]
MRFAHLALVTAILALPVHAQPAPTVEQTLVSLEKQSWAAWQRMDAAFWQRFLSDDHIEINGYVGAVGKKEVIGGIASKACKVSSYKVDHFIFRRIDPRTAVLVYRAEQDTMCGSIRAPSPVWATSLYQLRGGRWQNVLYEHTPALTPPKSAKTN